MPSRLRSQLVVLRELAHHRQSKEQLHQHIVVRRACGCLGVVFREAQATALVNKKRIQPRERTGRTETRVLDQQRLFPVEQTELLAEIAVQHRGFVDARKRSQQQPSSLLQQAILLRRQKPRAQYTAQRPLAKEQTTQLELRRELCAGLFGQFV